jgi:leucyl aminopeptidase
MNIQAISTFVATEGVVVFVPEQKFSATLQKSFGAAFPAELASELSERMRSGDFTGKKNEVLQVFPALKGVKKCIFVGMGDVKNTDESRRAAGTAIRILKKLKVTKILFLLPESGNWKSFLSGAMAGAYEFKLGDTKDRIIVDSLTLCFSAKISALEIKHETSVAEAANFARDLINLPAGHMSPEELEQEAKKVATKEKHISCTVLDAKKLLQLKMGGIMGVGQGSAVPPRMIVLEYKGSNDKPIALVGKGVCFDSGGYNLKPTKHIESMHSDMAGAATVLGVFHWIAATQPKINVVGVLGAVENMVSGNAFKPGDIITLGNGQTCEITNTDAEGRLVLADCLHHVVTHYKPAKIIDFATLTGACIAALGNEITGVMTNKQELLKSFSKVATSCDEAVWELPITPLFREKIKSEVADLQCWTAGVNAGTSMGGAFLENFVQETPWVHCDIAGTAYRETGGDELAPRGATGVLIRTVCEWIQK